MSSSGFLATMKTFAPSIRRRRRVDKQNLELHNNNNNNNEPAVQQPRSSSAATTPTGDTLGVTSAGTAGRGGIAAGIHGVGEVISPAGSWDIVPPITPPAAFLPPGYKRLSMKGLLSNVTGFREIGLQKW